MMGERRGEREGRGRGRGRRREDTPGAADGELDSHPVFEDQTGHLKTETTGET